MRRRPQDNGSTPEQEMTQLSRRSFLWAALAAGSTFGAWKWFNTQPKVGGLVAPLRTGLEWNQMFIQSTYGVGKLSRTFDSSAIEALRVNGGYGLNGVVDNGSFAIRLISSKKESSIPLKDVLALPMQEYITELRCVEGWRRIYRWRGCRISDFIEAFAPGDASKFMAMETPDGGYYVGLDRASFMHPQALLCSEMNGAPLLPMHGAPLRLAMPVKYGYKQLKRIGTIRLSDEMPRDYWAERGFDWFAAL